MPRLVVLIAALACALAAAAEDTPNIRAVDGALYLDSATGKPVAFRGDDGSYISLQDMAHNLTLAMRQEDVAAMIQDAMDTLRGELKGVADGADAANNALASTLRGEIGSAQKAGTDAADTVQTNVDKIDGRVTALEAYGTHTKTLQYTTHLASTGSFKYISIGEAEVEDVIHLDFTDAGCNSGLGYSYTISASYGVHRNAYPVASAPERPVYQGADTRFTLKWKNTAADKYELMIAIAHWPACNGNLNLRHTMTVSVRSSANTFSFRDDVTYDASFQNMVTVSNGYYDRAFSWIGNGNPIPTADHPIGSVNVDQTLQVEVSDSGCGSGIGMTFFISSRWGVNKDEIHPTVSMLPSAHEPLTDRFSLYYKALAPDSYMLYLHVDGWPDCVSKGHVTTVSVQTSDPRFNPYEGEPFNKNTYTKLEMNLLQGTDALVGSDAFQQSVGEVVADELSSDEFFDAVDKHLHRKKIEWSWVTHKPDAAGGTAIPLGLTRVDALLDIKVSDDGCASGLGMDFKLSSPYGVDTVAGRAPRVFALGSYALTSLEDKFQFYWKAKDNDEYYLYLRITGWGACNQDTSGRPHFTEVTIETTDAAHDFDDTDTFSEAEYAKVQRIDVGRDLVPDGNGNLPLFGNLPFRVIRRTWSSTIAAQTWTKIFTNPGFLPTGGFQVFMPRVRSAGKGGDIWDESYIGEFSWFAGTTNDAAQHLEEILLHGSGHANNQQDIKLRTVRNPAPGTLEMQMWSSAKWTSPVTINFIFLQLF